MLTPGGAGITYVAGMGGGQAVSFSGASYLTSQPLAVLPSGNAPRSVAHWLLLATAPAANYITLTSWGINYQSAASATMIGGTDDPFSTGFLFDADDLPGLTHITPSVNVWHHLAVTFDGALVTIWIDGVQVFNSTTAAYFSTPFSTMVTVANTPLVVGGLGMGTWCNACFLNGSIDRLLIYDRALSPAEVAVLAVLPFPSTATPIATPSFIPPPVYTISSVAGNGEGGYSGDGGPAIDAKLWAPGGVVVAESGGAFIADGWNRRIRYRNANTGIITTVVGTGDAGSTGDGGPATSATLINPVGVALDSSSNIYVSDYDAYRVRRISSSTGIINTFAGTGYGWGGDNGPATLAQIGCPYGLAFDKSTGVLYIADVNNNRVRAVATSGFISTVAGSGNGGYGGDGGLAVQALLAHPAGLAVSGGVLYIADNENHRIRAVLFTTGIIFTVAGSNAGYPAGGGFSGNGDLAVLATLNYPRGVAVDGAGNIWIADSGNSVVRYVSAATGVIYTVAGNGTAGYTGDGLIATSSELNQPYDVTIGPSGTVWIVDPYTCRLSLLACIGNCPVLSITCVLLFIGLTHPVSV